MIVCQPQVEQDGSKDGMNKIFRCQTVSEIAHGLHSRFELVGGRWFEKYFAFVLLNPNDFAGGTKSAGSIVIL
jgi:hypothetical protein